MLQTVLSNITQTHNFSIAVNCFSLYGNSSPGAASDTTKSHSLNDQVYSEATPTQPNYSYNMLTMDTEGLNAYESIGQSQQKTNTQNTPATFTPVRDEASKEEAFYVAEEHTYAVVNKKKVSENDVGGAEFEREEPQSES